MIDLDHINEKLIDADEYVKTDKLKLDEEFEKQSVLYNTYSAIRADIERERCELRSKLMDKTRMNHIKERGKPASEAFVENEYKNNEKYIEISYLIERLDGIIKSLDNKKIALGKLADLAIAGYFSSPITRREREY